MEAPRQFPPRLRGLKISACMVSYWPVSTVVSFPLARLSYASNWLIGRLISEQKSAPFVLDFSFYYVNSLKQHYILSISACATENNFDNSVRVVEVSEMPFIHEVEWWMD
jgi:hypothetical protein